MKRTFFGFAVLVITTLLPQAVQGVQRIWNNTATDFNSAGSWANGAPGLGDVALFNTGPGMQPNLSASLSIAGLYFTTSNGVGYDLTATNAASLTLTAIDTNGSGGTSDSTAAAIRSDNTAFSNTIDAPLVLAPSSGNQSAFVQASGGSLIVNGAISSTAGTNLSLRGGGVFQLIGSNSQATTSIDAAGVSLSLGNNGALGAGTLTINSTANLAAVAGARSISNPLVLAGNATLLGGNAFTFSGSVTSSGSSGRTLSVSNTGGTTLNGPISLEEAGAPVGRQLTIDGTRTVVINGVIQNGDTNAASLRYNGISTISLNNINTYTGGTILSGGGRMIVTKDGGLGSGNVILQDSNVTLTLQTGVANNYIADAATLSIGNTDTVNLNFSGSDTINTLTINGTNQATGTWGAPGSGAMHTSSIFIGTGTLNVLNIPEPHTYALLSLSAFLVAQRFWRRRKLSEALERVGEHLS